MFRDKVIKISYIISILLAACHLRQFILSGYMFDPFIRLIFCILYTPSVLIFGKESIFKFFIIFAYILVWINDFCNYTSFTMIMIAIYLMPKYKKQFLTAYSIDFIMAFAFMDNAISHIIIHTLNCITIYYFFTLISSFITVKPLELTKSEIKILDELCEGKKPKEVTCYSSNTVYKRIQEAKARNNCISTSELLMRFKITRNKY